MRFEAAVPSLNLKYMGNLTFLQTIQTVPTLLPRQHPVSHSKCMGFIQEIECMVFCEAFLSCWLANRLGVVWKMFHPL